MSEAAIDKQESGAGARTLFAAIAGGLFGVGLAFSEMANPARVLGFLDVAGTWDPTLAFVMIGALAVTVPAFYLQRRTSSPWFADQFSMPTKTDLDRPLLLGAVMFGVGWGLAGFCPGPAVVATATGQVDVFAFVLAMLAGLLAGGRLRA